MARVSKILFYFILFIILIFFMEIAVNWKVFPLIKVVNQLDKLANQIVRSDKNLARVRLPAINQAEEKRLLQALEQNPRINEIDPYSPMTVKDFMHRVPFGTSNPIRYEQFKKMLSVLHDNVNIPSTGVTSSTPNHRQVKEIKRFINTQSIGK